MIAGHDKQVAACQFFFAVENGTSKTGVVFCGTAVAACYEDGFGETVAVIGAGHDFRQILSFDDGNVG